MWRPSPAPAWRALYHRHRHACQPLPQSVFELAWPIFSGSAGTERSWAVHSTGVNGAYRSRACITRAITSTNSLPPYPFTLSGSAGVGVAGAGEPSEHVNNHWPSPGGTTRHLMRERGLDRGLVKFRGRSRARSRATAYGSRGPVTEWHDNNSHARKLARFAECCSSGGRGSTMGREVNR
jgi:hypothetical protein